MRVVVQFTVREEERALPILLRHSPGMVLRDRVYVLTEDAVNAIHSAGIRFTELSRETDPPVPEGTAIGERV
jgi:hypothetical protein